VDEQIPLDSHGSTGPVHEASGVGLTRRQMVVGMAAIGGITALGGSTAAWAGERPSPDRLTPAKFVDRFEHIYGVHPGFRRNHAKGLSASGTFTANGAGVALCRAAVFAPGTTPVLARFSLAGGSPTAGDANPVTRGLGLLFQRGSGEQWRTAMINLPVFPDAQPRGFYERLLATAPVPSTGQPDPAKLAAFLAKHPETARAMALIKATPPASGFANSTFRSLNAFHFTNRAGRTVPVRWSLVPEDAVAPGPKDPPADHDYLFHALIERLHSGPARWHLRITLGAPGDPTNDATLPWPADRPAVDVGILAVDAVHTEAAGNTRDINFDPLVLPAGIAPSADPLLGARSAVYAQSFRRRTHEPHTASSIDVDHATTAHGH
jgi:catalase